MGCLFYVPRVRAGRGSACAALLLVAALAWPAWGAGPYRSYDGYGNHVADPEAGMAGTALMRMTTMSYEDGMGAAVTSRPGARVVSNLVCAQDDGPMPNAAGLSDLFWQWGQFLDHDIDLTSGGDPGDRLDIPVPDDDAWFPPGSMIPMTRSSFDPATGEAAGTPRQQMNAITAFIDASNVYGSDEDRAAALRRWDGSGRLATSKRRMLPFNEAGLPNEGGPSSALYLAGDVRANEQVALTAMHVVFLREHNRYAKRLAKNHPELDGETLYHEARAWVGALMQVITYREFLPLLLGPDALPPYEGYDDTIDPTIRNAFSTAAFRFGHSMLSPTLLRLKRNGKPIPAGNLPLAEAFFSPDALDPSIGKGVEPLLRGLATQLAQALDVRIDDAVRNFLFGPPGAGGFDLAALNIQRGRDHGLPTYNRCREDLGMAPALGFDDISTDPDIQARLAAAYGDVELVDLWVGGLAEDPVPGALVGPTFHAIIRDQFTALRDGDAWWYGLVFSGKALKRLEATTLGDVIARNTKIRRHELQDAVFLVDE